MSCFRHPPFETSFLWCIFGFSRFASFRGQHIRRTEGNPSIADGRCRANTKRHGREIARRAIEGAQAPPGPMPAASPAAARASSPFGFSRPRRHERAPAARHESGPASRRFTKGLRPRLDDSMRQVGSWLFSGKRRAACAGQGERRERSASRIQRTLFAPSRCRVQCRGRKGSGATVAKAVTAF